MNRMFFASMALLVYGLSPVNGMAASVMPHPAAPGDPLIIFVEG